MSLYTRETVINRTENYNCGSSGVYETFADTPGDLYRACLRNLGRCIGSIYIDKDGKATRVGWVFLKRERYEDTGQPFLCETWVEVHTGPPITSVNYLPLP